MAHSNQVPEFKKGMLVAYNILKDGKKHTMASMLAAFKKAKMKGAVGKAYRIGRIGRQSGAFDVLVVRDRETPLNSTFQLVRGVQAKKLIAAKTERYASLSESRAANAKAAKRAVKAKKAVKKVTTKKTTKASPKPKAVAVTEDDAVLEG